MVWQLVFRRDLADRLTVLATLYLVGAFCIVLLPAHWEIEHRPVVALVFLVMALVVTEQALRLRDERLVGRRRRSRETVPAGP